MRDLYTYVILVAAAFLAGCSKDDPSFGDMSGNMIYWSVDSVEGLRATKSLINSYDALVRSCTPAEDGGEGGSISVWADYTIDNDGVAETTKDVFSGTSIIYQDKVGGNPHSSWNYKGADLYWSLGGNYKFRAYYPTDADAKGADDTDGIQLGDGCNATVFQMNYNTMMTQEDLLVAYNTIDTRSWNLSHPVPLNFKHALSALQFRFQLINTPGQEYLDSDYLTSVWIENMVDESEKPFTSIGGLVYGNEGEGNEEKLGWTENKWRNPGDKLYEWVNDGVLMENRLEGSTVNTTQAVAYTAAGTTSGQMFTGNDGFLLVIPQRSEGNVKLFFTTSHGGDTEYSITIPKITGTDLNGPSETGEYFIPGYRYIYTISITKTDIRLLLTIRPWNKLDSSYSYNFG